MIRNLAETGQPLGPRFEGGADEPLYTTVRLALIGTGNIVVGDGWSDEAKAGGASSSWSRSQSWPFWRSAAASPFLSTSAWPRFAATSFVVPIIARRITANDIELRVMSPMLIPVVYFAAVVFDRLCTARAAAIAGTALLGWWIYQGAAFAVRFPDLAPGGAVTSRSSLRSCTTSSTRCPPTRRSSPTTRNGCGGSPIASRP